MIGDSELQLRELRVAISVRFNFPNLLVVTWDQNTRDELFEALDLTATGEVSREQLHRFNDLNNVALSTSENELLFRRLDKNEDGLITFNDFVTEMGI